MSEHIEILKKWAIAVEAVSAMAGIDDDEKIPTWPSTGPRDEEFFKNYPALTVGAAREINSVIQENERLKERVAELEKPTHECEIGIYGMAYDRPRKCRAYTFRHQPHNKEAYSLGLAARRAHSEKSGDEIDRGLFLLKHLESEGFGVFELSKEPANEG